MDIERVLNLLRKLEWEEVDLDLRPCYGRCPVCGALMMNHIGNGRYQGSHRIGCEMYLVITELEGKL